jgi:voltage-gated potassium channel Kch
MSRGTIALIGWLAVVSLIMIIVVSLLVALLGIAPSEDNQSANLIEILWMSLLRTLDPGTMGGDQGWGFRLAMLGITLGGIFIVSTLIGVLSSGIEGRVEDLRKGRSLVIETDHTLILGWSDHVFTIISELVLANANRPNPRIVILADKDKVEMEDEIRTKVPNPGKTRIVCRTGSPIDLDDLEIVNPQGSRSIIVLAPSGDDEPDSQVIKTILALTNNPQRRREPYHIVAEIHEPRNLEAARLVGGDEAQLVDVGDVISRLIAQTCRQSGLSVVYTELLDFGGDEIYFQEEPRLVGKTFAEAMFAYEKAVIVGLSTGDGQVKLNPPMDTRINAGDKLIAIAEDDDKILLSGLTDVPIDAAAIRDRVVGQPEPERTLLLGWNRRAPTIINELDSYVAPGSVVTVVATWAGARDEIGARCANLQNMTVTFEEGDTTDRRTLDRLSVDTYQHIVVLCYSELLTPQRADARTLITLLHLRDMEARLGERFSIVSEMLDDRNRELAEVTKADDFIVSDKLISLMLSQVSENKHLRAVFADLFDPAGSEIYLKPIAEYVEPGGAMTFHTVVEAARRCGEVALGYRIMAAANDAKRSYGIVLNPLKSDQVTFAPGDRIVVLAES